QHADENGAEGFFTSVKEGVDYIRNRPLLRGLAYSCGVAMLGGGVLFALGVGYVHQTLKGGDVQFGFLMGIFEAGMLGGFVISQLKPPGGVKWMVRIALLTMGSVLIVMGIFPVIWIAYGLASVFGASFSTAVIVAMSAVQGRTDDAHRGRVMAVVHMLFRVALSVGALAAAGIASAVPNGGLHLPILVFGISVMMVQRSGSHQRATFPSRNARKSSGVAVASSFSTTHASGRSSHFSSGTPITAASTTSG